MAEYTLEVLAGEDFTIVQGGTNLNLELVFPEVEGFGPPSASDVTYLDTYGFDVETVQEILDAYIASANDTFTSVQDSIDAQVSALAAEVVLRIAGDSALTTALLSKADLVGGLIPTSQIPAVALTVGQVVANRAAMLALTAQTGDIAVISGGADKGTYMLDGTSDPTAFANWILLGAPTDVVQTVNGQQGTVILSKSDIGLGNVDNTSDANKPVSIAQAAALAPKADPTFSGVVYSSGGFRFGMLSKSAAYTLLANDPTFILADTTTAGFTITLPTGAPAGTLFLIKKIDSAFNNVTLAGTIDGQTNQQLTIQYDWMLIAATGTGANFHLVSSNKLLPGQRYVAATDLGTVLSSSGMRLPGATYALNTAGFVQFGGAFRRGLQTTTVAANVLGAGTAVTHQRQDATAQSQTVTLPSTTTVGYEHNIIKVDSTANKVTVSVSGGGTINGLTSIDLTKQYDYISVISTAVAGVWLLVGTNILSVPDVQQFVSTVGADGTGTWVNPSPTIARPMLVEGVDGGSGGGSGRRGAAGSGRGGGGAGHSGARFTVWLMTTDLPATVPYKVGRAGAGGAAVTVDSTDGNPGNTGQDTYLGTTGDQYGAWSHGFANAGSAGQGGTAIGGGAGGGSNGNGIAGGGGGFNSNGVAGGGPGLQQETGWPSGGGGGGAISSVDVSYTGATGGAVSGVNGGAAGAIATNGGVGTPMSTGAIAKRGGLGGGGGGGGTSTVKGGDGGNGASYGGGGGGGGASFNGFASGKGGDGGVGYLKITVF